MGDVRPLTGLRVCELSIAIAGPTCGKYLAYFGADVVKVESDRNPDVLRLLARDTGVAIGEFNAGKRSVGLDLKTEGGAKAMRRLLASSDVFLTNYTAPAIGNLGLTYDEVAAVRPDIVYAALPGFGSDPATPYYEYVAWGPNQAPLVGLEAITGFPDHDPAGIATISYPDYSSGVHAVVAVLAELHRRAETGQGAQIDLSQMEATVSLLGPLVLAYGHTGVTPVASGNRQPGVAPQGVYPCRGDDRWVAVTVTSDAQWQSLCTVADHREWIDDRRLSTAEARAEHHDLTDELISAWTLLHRSSEVAQWLQEAGVAAAVVADNEALVVDPQLAARQFWALAPHPRIGTDLFTSVPVHLSETPGRFTNAGPPFAEDTVDVLRDICGYTGDEIAALVDAGAAWMPSVSELEPTDRPWRDWARVALPDLPWGAAPEPSDPTGDEAPATPRPEPVGDTASDRDSLTGLRVVAIGGPEIAQAVRVFAGLGAEVVLAEPPDGGPLRNAPGGSIGCTVDEGLWLTAFAGGCRSVVVDPTQPEGQASLRRLAGSADVVLDGTAPGHLDGLGTGYDAVAAEHPSVVWVSVTPFGRDGPRRNWRGSNLVAWAGSGVLYTTGHPDTPPVVPGGPAALACHMAAVNAAVGALAALAARARTGKGQLVDVSMQETTVAVACETGVPMFLSDLQHRARQGNRRPLLRPWGLYACKDGWASIVILQPGHWDAIAAWMLERTGNEAASEPVFRDLFTRIETPDLLDQWAEELSATYTKQELFAEGQRRGVPVTPVTTVADLLADRHLAATGFWCEVDDPVLGRVRLPGPPWRRRDRPWRLAPAPALGADTAEILGLLATQP